jgi:hypothetical protein
MAKPLSNTPWASNYVVEGVIRPDGSADTAENKTVPNTTTQDNGVLYRQPLINNYLNYKLDELSRWVDWVGVDVDNPLYYKKATVERFIDDTSVIASPVNFRSFTINTKTTVGPAGSGADVTWTALSSLTDNARKIKLRIQPSITYLANSSVAAGGSIFFYAQAGAGDDSDYELNNASYIVRERAWVFDTALQTGIIDCFEIEVPVDSDGVFSVRWSGSSDALVSGSCNAYLVSFTE